MKIAILCIGNRLMLDDGVGPAVYDALETGYRFGDDERELTAEEKEEQFRLRDEYIKEWRAGVLQTLENTYVVDDDGTEHKLTPKE